ncbi:hypothetical protein [Pseudorhodoplanes sinuspersici]|uniref:Uncharacterized protein n=1 Tax=Pseudorhodoplanes sinuspersici TaxID=1235591 RepID=A0A1W6ZZI7_9HYPH|nr:hypothetical protein [Pseudorhodoplanes sinuspersici]ARQ02740.1 hypothetical protein CAK95_04385 [Pseudorhodoplanes sinuspersici]RKE66080.1 hypothetical protein DFP91_5655 [Pseudorhodoplanes sinuspersici]
MPQTVRSVVFAVIFATLGVAASPASFAQAQQGQQRPLPMPFDMKGTPEEEAACAPDSSRFCKKFEPDAFQVLGCLQANRPKLTQACQRVLRNRGV